MRVALRPSALPLVLGVVLFALLGPSATGPALAQPTVDGDLSDADYVTVATRANSNNGFGDRTEVREIVYHADDVNDVLYVGVKAKLPTSNDNGIGLWLNFQALSGASAGTPLGSDVSGASHYLDGQGAGSNDDFKADFEVDYLVALSSGATSDEVFYNGLERVGGTAGNNFGSSDQSGGTTTHSFFGEADATFAFHNGGGSNQGFEMKIPYTALGDGVFEVGAMEAFAVVAGSDGSFSDETVPGDVTSGNPGTNPDFDNLIGGPYHGSKLFTSGSAGNWTAPATWSSGMVPFAGADVEIDSDVTLNTDATIHDLTITSGNTFTASDGNGRTLTLKYGGTVANSGTYSPNDGTLEVAGSGTVTVTDMLDLRSGSMTDVTVREGTLELQDTFLMDGVLTVRTFGTLQLSTSKNLHVNGNDVLVDGTLTLSQTDTKLRIENGDLTVNGTLDGNGKVTFGGGNSNSIIGGTTDPITFSSVKFDKGGKDVTLNTGVEVSREMTLLSGTVNTNGHALTLRSTATQTAAIRHSGRGQVNGDVTFERHVAMSSGASHFRFLSAPTTTKLDDEGSGSNAGSLLSNMWTQSESGTGADAQVSAGNASVYVYNEAADLNDSSPNLANGWEAVGQSGGNWGELNDLTGLSGQTTLDPGRGFLVYLFADRDFDSSDEGFPITLTATGPVQPEENSGNSITPPITFTGSDGDDPANNGWNLIANPFMAPIDWEAIERNGGDLTNVDATIYVWDADDGTYATYTADPSGSNGSRGGSDDQGRNIAPFQAFFVKATGSTPSIGGIERGEKDVGANPDLKAEPPGNGSPRVALRLRGAGDSSGETTAFRFTEGAAPGKDAYDAYQLTPLSASYALVASEMGGTDALFDHQRRPVPTAQDTIDLAFEITESGTYTLGADTLAGLPSDWNVILENVDSGARYDLGAGETVTFDYTVPKSAAVSGSSAIERMLKQGAPTVAKAGGDSTIPSFRLLVGPQAALPVELVGFDATLGDDGSAHLTWQTASETNNAAFHVQRRAVEAPHRDGSTGWTTIGRVEGAGTTDRRRTYHFTDEEVPFAAEQLTYRLRQEDLDGSTTLSEEIPVELGSPRRIRLHAPFPNPVRQWVTLRYEVPKRMQGADVRIALYDVLGRRVRALVQGSAEVGRHETAVSIRSLAPGTYFVRMQVDEHAKTRRLTVVR